MSRRVMSAPVVARAISLYLVNPLRTDDVKQNENDDECEACVGDAESVMTPEEKPDTDCRRDVL